MMKRNSAIALSLVLLAGCVTETPPAPAVTAFAPVAACTETPALAAAASLTPEEPAGRMERIVDLTAEAQCLRQASGGQVPYAIFALPTQGKVASISAGAILEENRIVPPVVSTLAADGRVLRTFAADDFHQRGRGVSVLFAPRAGETFVLVTPEPTRVGGAHMLVAGDPNGATVPSHLRPSMSRAYSFAGQVFARVYFSDPDL
jgi:hypothetical protein